MNYGASLTDMYHQVGAYSVRILKGANPRTLFPHQRCPPSANRQEGERAGAVPSSSATRRRPSRHSASQGAIAPDASASSAKSKWTPTIAVSRPHLAARTEPGYMTGT